MKLTYWLLAGLFASSSLYAQDAAAQNIEMRYSTLYSKLKQNVKEGHDDVKIALFLLNQQDGSVCHIHKGSMRKDKHFEELVIPENNELTVPVDSNLRQANPDVTFVIDDGITCDVSMQVIAKKDYGTAITQTDIAELVPQMNELLSALGGMFSDWFMPDVEGVVVHFNDGDTKVIRLSSLADGETVNFHQPTVKVTPWVPRG
ncbi:DUF2987 domain-containing protein [Photobacterium lutimaris]|uniref:DUF2987 domain-containing protein n=1 Tax=Photobacterium lutimaris TaxID=388278 RepID=A0A2T3J0U1_9GAMM|nr:DUF2987 domain-containing protein [Photobacterium lutimaris]PSU34705.1 DUF2987 domain-containing protein [Photobacterium lutimaris]TDR77025.1 DUF2987 family protein [Photobacterium lutimaris]